MFRRNKRGALVIVLSFLASVARADPAADTADLIAILRAVHADRCGVANWRGPGNPLVISDRPIQPRISAKTKPAESIFDIELLPRAAPGTLWPRVTLCPGIGVVDHVRLELVLKAEEAPANRTDVLGLAFGASSYEEITLPAFSANGNRAVVYRAHNCLLCGDGTYFEVIRIPGGWRVSRRQRVWAS